MSSPHLLVDTKSFPYATLEQGTLYLDIHSAYFGETEKRNEASGFVDEQSSSSNAAAEAPCPLVIVSATNQCNERELRRTHTRAAISSLMNPAKSSWPFDDSFTSDFSFIQSTLWNCEPDHLIDLAVNCDYTTSAVVAPPGTSLFHDNSQKRLSCLFYRIPTRQSTLSPFWEQTIPLRLRSLSQATTVCISIFDVSQFLSQCVNATREQRNSHSQTKMRLSEAESLLEIIGTNRIPIGEYVYGYRCPHSATATRSCCQNNWKIGDVPKCFSVVPSHNWFYTIYSNDKFHFPHTPIQQFPDSWELMEPTQTDSCYNAFRVCLNDNGYFNFRCRYEVDIDATSYRTAAFLHALGVRKNDVLAYVDEKLLHEIDSYCRDNRRREVMDILPLMENVFRQIADTITAGFDRRVAVHEMHSLRRQIMDKSAKATGSSGSRKSRFELPPVTAMQAQFFASGMKENEFVGLVSYLAAETEQEVVSLFRRMDANSDGTLTWDEYMSYMIKHSDNMLAGAASEGTFLLEPPPRTSGYTMRVKDNVITRMLSLPSLCGYAVAYKSGDVNLWDFRFRCAINLNMGSAPVPPPHVFPMKDPPTTTGRYDKNKGAVNPSGRRRVSEEHGRKTSFSEAFLSEYVDKKVDIPQTRWKGVVESPFGFTNLDAFWNRKATRAASLIIQDSLLHSNAPTASIHFAKAGKGSETDVYIKPGGGAENVQTLDEFADAVSRARERRRRRQNNSYGSAMVTDMAVDEWQGRCRLLVVCANYTIRIYNLQKHTPTSARSLKELVRRADATKTMKMKIWKDAVAPTKNTSNKANNHHGNGRAKDRKSSTNVAGVNRKSQSRPSTAHSQLESQKTRKGSLQTDVTGTKQTPLRSRDTTITGNHRNSSIKAGYIGMGTEFSKGTGNDVVLSEQMHETDAAEAVENWNVSKVEFHHENNYLVSCETTVGAGPGVPTKILVIREDPRKVHLTPQRQDDDVCTIYVVGDSMGYVTGYNVNDFSRIGMAEAPCKSITCLEFIPTLGVAVGGMKGSMSILDLETFSFIHTFSPASYPLREIAWCGKERFLLTLSYDRTLRTWDPFSSTEHIASFGNSGASKGPVDDIKVLKVNDYHNQIVILRAGGKLEVWDPRSLRCIQTAFDAVGKAHASSSVAAQAIKDAEQISSEIASKFGDLPVPETSRSAERDLFEINKKLERTKVPLVKDANDTGNIGKSPRQGYEPNVSYEYNCEGAFFDFQRLSLVTYGSHFRIWRVREVEGGLVSAANHLARQLRRKDNLSVCERLPQPFASETTRNSHLSRCIEAENEDKNKRVQSGQSGNIVAVLCSIPFQQLVVVDFSGNVNLWELFSGQRKASFRVYHTAQRSKTTFAIGGNNSAQSALESTRLRLGNFLNTQSTELSSAALDTYQRRLITGSIDGSVRIWNMSNGSLMRSYPCQQHEITQVCMQSGEKLYHAIVGSMRQGFLSWWTDEGEVKEEAEKDHIEIDDSLETQDEKSDEEYLSEHKKEVAEKELKQYKLYIHTHADKTYRKVKDTSQIPNYASGKHGTVNMTPLTSADPATGQCINNDADIQCIAVGGISNTSKGKSSTAWVASGSSDGTFALWDPENEEVLHVHKLQDGESPWTLHDTSIECMVNVANRPSVIVGTAYGYLHVCNTITGNLVELVQNSSNGMVSGIGCNAAQANRAVTVLRTDDEGSRLFAGFEDGLARIFDISTVELDAADSLKTPIKEWQAHMDAISSCCFLPEGAQRSRLFASASRDKVLLWTMQGGFVAELGVTKPWSLRESEEVHTDACSEEEEARSTSKRLVPENAAKPVSSSLVGTERQKPEAVRYRSAYLGRFLRKKGHSFVQKATKSPSQADSETSRYRPKTAAYGSLASDRFNPAALITVREEAKDLIHEPSGVGEEQSNEKQEFKKYLRKYKQVVPGKKQPSTKAPKPPSPKFRISESPRFRKDAFKITSPKARRSPLPQNTPRTIRHFFPSENYDESLASDSPRHSSYFDSGSVDAELGHAASPAAPFSHFKVPESTAKVPEEARVPYEYLGSGRWRKLPESSPRNYDNWDKYRQMQQGSIYRRLQTSLQRQLDSFS